MCTQLPPRPKLCQVSEDFPDHWVQPKVHLSALHICLCSAVGTDICAISSVVLSWSLSLGKVGLNERRKNLKRELRGRWTSGRLKTCSPKGAKPVSLEPHPPTMRYNGPADLCDGEVQTNRLGPRSQGELPRGSDSCSQA